MGVITGVWVGVGEWVSERVNVCENMCVRARVFMQVQGCACVTGYRKRGRERERGEGGGGREITREGAGEQA